MNNAWFIGIVIVGGLFLLSWKLLDLMMNRVADMHSRYMALLAMLFIFGGLYSFWKRLVEMIANID